MPEVSAEFVAAMEDVLELYAEPYDPRRPKVNFDEASKQLIAETRQPLPSATGTACSATIMSIERNGTRNLFIIHRTAGGLGDTSR